MYTFACGCTIPIHVFGGVYIPPTRSSIIHCNVVFYTFHVTISYVYDHGQEWIGSTNLWITHLCMITSSRVYTPACTCGGIDLGTKVCAEQAISTKLIIAMASSIPTDILKQLDSCEVRSSDYSIHDMTCKNFHVS